LLLILAGAPASGQTFDKALSRVRAGREDLAIRADRWDTGFKLPAVEALLADPLQAPGVLEGWSHALSSASSLSSMTGFAAGLLGSHAEAGPPAKPAAAQEWIILPSTAAAQAINGILASMAAAQSLVDRSVASLRPEERELAVRILSAMLRNEYALRQEDEALRAAARFDQDGMMAAAALAAGAAEAAWPVLQDHASEMRGFPRTRFKSPVGDVLVSGPGDDLYEAADLDGVALLVDFGGASHYLVPPAAAGTGQQRVVIDLSANVRVETSSASASAGSGIFGVGLLYLPNRQGRKSLSAGDFSLGAGLFGVGGLFLRGQDSRLEGGRFTSGAGAFGLGLLYSEGDSAALSADLAGQGYGFTRGFGLFALHGSGARLDCGLRYPDGHEAAAMISLCQGTGYGPRAFAAGGVGLASIQGDGSQLRSSYNAQGSGYWHGLGGLFLAGSGNHLQARRYCQGAGVHTAVGALVWKGDHNQLRDWGVGPGFGWDYGVGLLLGEGDGNSLGSDWGSGRGDTDGHGLVAIRGRGNRLALHDLGTGLLSRGAPGYGLVVVDGDDNRYKPADPSPWGWVQGDGLDADAGLEPAPADWPPVERQAAQERDRARLALRFTQAQNLPLDQRLQAWLSILAEDSLDFSVPMQVAVAVLGLAPSEGAALARWVDPRRFDDLIWLRVFLPAFGRAATLAQTRELAVSSGLRKALLLGSLAGGRVADAVAAAEAASTDRDWRVRRSAIGALGGLFDREEGEAPGRLRLLEAGESICRSAAAGPAGPRWEDLLPRIGAKFLWDFFSVLALDAEMPAADRVRLFVKAGDPFDRLGSGSEASREFARALQERAAAYGPAIRKELEDCRSLEARGRRAFLRALRDPEPEVVQAGIISLGQLGREPDAGLVAGFLKSDRAFLREAAAAALGKMGAAAAGEIRRCLRAREPRVRALAALAAAQSGSADVLPLLREAFHDRDAEVRRTAVAGLFAVQDPWRPRRKDFLPQLRRLEQTDADPQVRSAAGRAAAIISRD
jgi:HEAT repeat protein